MLRLYDHRTGRPEPLPAGPVLRVQILDGAGRRVPVVADLLRRVAERAGRRVRVAAPRVGGDWADYNIAPMDDVVADADVFVGDVPDPDALSLIVPRETGRTPPDGLTARLAMLEVPYREPLELSEARLAKAAERLGGWRGKVADWATAPGRPLSRAYVTEAEAALADDLNTPAALAVLDRLAGDADVPPGAKLETFIHLDLVLALGLVAAIGSV